MDSSDQRMVGRVASLLVVIWLVGLTLKPDDTPNLLNLVPFREKGAALECILAGCWHARESARFLIVDVLGNIAVFVPLGAALVLATTPRRAARGAGGWSYRRRWQTAVLVGAALSLGVEVAQLLIPSRATDVDDLILNALGTAVGAGLTLALETVFRRRKLDAK